MKQNTCASETFDATAYDESITQTLYQEELEDLDLVYAQLCNIENQKTNAQLRLTQDFGQQSIISNFKRLERRFTKREPLELVVVMQSRKAHRTGQHLLNVLNFQRSSTSIQYLFPGMTTCFLLLMR